MAYSNPMPSGGTRLYEGQPTFGIWNGERFKYNFRGKNVKVARLVCEAFHGPPIPQQPYCLHINENAADNKPENLKWGTQKENLNAVGFIAYCRTRTGDDSPSIKGKHRRMKQID